MATIYEMQIPVNENSFLISNVNGIISEFMNSLGGYEQKYEGHSLYYSGYESSDKREETQELVISQKGVKKGFLKIHREQRDLPAATNDFPFGIADVSIKVYGELEDQQDQTFGDRLANLFGRLENYKGLILYLCEDQFDDGTERCLDLIVGLEPMGVAPRKTLELDSVEAGVLAILNKDQLHHEIFRRFGITDLKPHPGYPKGPFYFVNEDVYKALYGKK